MLRTAAANIVSDPAEAGRDANGTTAPTTRPRSPSGPPPPPVELPPPDASYAHESAHHYQAAIQAALHHHPHHLPPLTMHLPPPPPPPPGMYAPPPPQPPHRRGHDSEGEGSGADDSGDEYVPPPGVHPLPPDDPYSQQTQSTTGGGPGALGESQGSFVDTQAGSGDSQNTNHGGEGPTSSGGRQKRGRRHENDEEWNRVRKDNHKEVERRRRSNINEGIAQLAAIVPNSTGAEKAKGATLTRAVAYIQQLKDNEARNIEKWTLEKLLMDQAMTDLTNQLEDMKRRWEVEAQARIGLEREVEMLKAKLTAAPSTAASAAPAAAASETAEVGSKRPRVE